MGNGRNENKHVAPQFDIQFYKVFIKLRTSTLITGPDSVVHQQVTILFLREEKGL